MEQIPGALSGSDDQQAAAQDVAANQHVDDEAGQEPQSPEPAKSG